MPFEVPPAVCERCLSREPVREVAVHRHVGLVLVFRHHVETGFWCAPCFERVFWRDTVITSLFGWWGVISLFATVVSLSLNVRSYVNLRFGWDAMGWTSDAPSNRESLERMLYSFLRLKDPGAAQALRLGTAPVDDPGIRLGGSVALVVLAALGGLWGALTMLDSVPLGVLCCSGASVLGLGGTLAGARIVRRNRPAVRR